MIDVATLRLRYPAFTAVADQTIQYWLTDAARIVTAGWGADQEPGTFALAAHNMALSKAPGLTGDEASQLPAGVTRFRSASMDVAISEAVASRSASGGYASTAYGVEFLPMLRRNQGGPMLVGNVEPVECGW